MNERSQESSASFEQSLGRRLVGGGAWTIGGTAVAVLAGLVSNVLLARILTPDGLGSYFLVFSVVSVAAIIARLGLDRAGVRLVAETQANDVSSRTAGVILRIVQIVSLSAVVVALLLVSGGAEWLATNLFGSPGMAQVSILVGVWLLVEAPRLVVSELQRGFHDYARATIYGNGTRNVVAACLFAALAVSSVDSLRSIIWLAIAASAATLIGASVALGGRLRRLGTAARVKASVPLRIGVPLMFASVATLGLSQGDIWVVGATLPTADVALYGAAVRVAMFMALPLVVLNAVVSPTIVELHSAGRRGDLQHALRTTATVAVLPAFVGFVVIAIAGEPLLEILFGAFYEQGTTVMVLLALAQVVAVGMGPCGTVLVMTGAERLVMGVTIAAATLTVVAEIVLAPRAGLTGVAIASGAGVVAQNIALLVLARRHVGVWTCAELRPSAVARSMRELRETPANNAR